MIAFDAAEPIEPFQFQLRDPNRIRRKIATPEGKAAGNAAVHARRAAKRVPTGDVGPSITPREAAKSAYAEARQANPTAATYASDGSRKPPPRVFKRKVRSYGHRLLRINQDT